MFSKHLPIYGLCIRYVVEQGTVKLFFFPNLLKLFFREAHDTIHPPFWGLAGITGANGGVAGINGG